MEVVLKAVDNHMKVMAGELQDLQTAMKQADHRHDCLQKWIVHRIQTMEKCVGEDNFEERLRDQWLNQERLRERQASFEERMRPLEDRVAQHNNKIGWVDRILLRLDLADDRMVSLERQTDTIEKSTKEQIAKGLRPVESDLTRLYVRTEQIAEELQALQTNWKHEYLQAARELAATLFANLENRVEEVEKVMRAQAEVIAEVQHTATEQATNFFDSADYWQASFKNRMESIVRLTKALVAEATSKCENRLQQEKAAMEQAAREQADKEIVWLTVCTNDGQTCLEERMTSLENRVTTLENHMGAQTELQALRTVEDDEDFILVSDRCFV